MLVFLPQDQSLVSKSLSRSSNPESFLAPREVLASFSPGSLLLRSLSIVSNILFMVMFIYEDCIIHKHGLGILLVAVSSLTKAFFFVE